MDAEGQRHDDHRHLPGHRDTDQNQLRAMIDPIAQNGTTDWVNRAHFNKAVQTRTARIEALRQAEDVAERAFDQRASRWPRSASASARRRREYSGDSLASFRISRLR